MQTDRELLELAAKAAGYQLDGLASLRIVQGVGADDYLRINEQGGHSVWNPLTDDGDALRLAVALKLPVQFPDFEDKARSWGSKRDPEFYEEAAADHGGNLAAATRRAIVRAAASMGGREG